MSTWDDLSAREVQAAGLYPYFKAISRSEDTVVVIEGKERIMMGSNNYLGLTHHSDVIAASVEATQRYGAGAGFHALPLERGDYFVAPNQT